MKEKKGSPIKYILLIPIGVILFIYLFDIGQGIYFNQKLKSDLKQVMNTSLSTGGTNTNKDYINIAKYEFEEKGYQKDDLYLYEIEDKTTGFIVIGYSTYKKIGKEAIGFFIDLYNEFTGSNQKYNSKVLIQQGIKAYYNDFKEIVIEDYNEDLDKLEYQS